MLHLGNSAGDVLGGRSDMDEEDVCQYNWATQLCQLGLDHGDLVVASVWASFSS